jgi:hypothetical protein
MLLGSDIIEVEVRLPLTRILDADNTIKKLTKFLMDYAILNPHIGFTFMIEGKYARRLEATQPILPNWSNQTSIYYYKNLQEFEDFITGLEGGKEQDEKKIYDVLYNIRFREISNLSKSTDFLQITLGELKQNHKYIEKIYGSLLNKNITNMGPPTTLSLPFSTKPAIRKKAIEDRIKQLGISCQLVKYKQKVSTYSIGHEEDDIDEDTSERDLIEMVETGNLRVPFVYEVIVVHSDINSSPANLYFTEALNSSTMPNNYLVFYGSYDHTFQWKKKERNGKKEKKEDPMFECLSDEDDEEEDDEEDDNNSHKAKAITDILRKYGYTHEDKGRKRHSRVIANLICPRINYRSYGKSNIDVLPFADTIAEVTAKACSGGGGRDKDKTQLAALRQVLRKRKEEYLLIQNPVERKKKEWTQSDVFYATRKLLVTQYGYTDQGVNREHITSSIRDECAKLGVTREQIGIIAADRAQLYYKEKWTDVGLDEIEKQVEYGTDLVMVEKEGIVSQINLLANRKAIALLNTRGFFVEYASKLAKLADKRGCNVSLLVDWDVSGLLIFLKVRRIIPGVKRIGVDFKTVDDLGLRAADVEEKYTPDKGHLKSLKKELAELTDLERREFGQGSDLEKEYVNIQNNLGYLEEKRIEINSIVSELNDNARFWNWVEEQLRDCFPDRDFMRSVDIPDYVEPEPLQRLNDIIRQKGTAVLKPRKEELEDKLSYNNIENAFLFDRTNKVQLLANYDISDYEKAVTGQFQKIIENSDKVKPYLEKIEELLKQAEYEDNNKKNTDNKSNEDINQN